MLLKQLKLENIRSYTHSEINFPEGALLLSGDIGAGKSSLLLAIEFALFGIQKGSLSGGALLRNGAREGKVELTFGLGNNEITVCRSLKRGANAISQDAGYIVVNGAKEIGTAVELKSKILSLLGYPKEFLTKKNLLYRYTVYTPQEDMKQILFESAEDRLNILRKVFDIEKYKRVKENTSLYLRSLREKVRHYEGMLVDVESKKGSLVQKKKHQEGVVAKVNALQPQVEAMQKELQEKQVKVNELEAKARELEQIKQQLKGLDTELQVIVSNRQKQQDELQGLLTDIEVLKKEIVATSVDSIDKELYELKKEIEKRQKFEHECGMKIAECKTKKKHEEDLKKKILEIDNCPVCLQYVTEDHKENISTTSDERIEILVEHLNEHEEMMKKNVTESTKLTLKQDHLLEQQKLAAVMKEKKKQITEKEERCKKIEEFIGESKKKIGEINTKKIEMQEKVINLAEVDVNYNNLKQEIVKIQNEERSLAVQFSSLSKEKELVNLQITELEKEIMGKEDIKKELEKVNLVAHWLQDYFVSLMDVMEKHVFSSIYYQFNERFQHWFNVLMEDDTIQVRLDDTFTPIIEQNGYETSLEHLSGGEKTSCALAYRLALNKAINDLIGHINTKDLLILDEPTDGFSMEQLDRVRDVLDELGLKQVIIVSHESKIESFVDHVIRVEKTEHSSRIG